jgi:fluoride exporter
MSRWTRTFVFVGILGGFTTFSSFMLDNFTLAHGGQLTQASTNLLAQNILGIAAVSAGYYAAVWLR